MINEANCHGKISETPIEVNSKRVCHPRPEEGWKYCGGIFFENSVLAGDWAASLEAEYLALILN